MLFIPLLSEELGALEPVILEEGKGKYPLGLHLEILEDKGGKLTIDDVRKPEMGSMWFKSKWEVPNFGYTKSAYWLRFKLISTIGEERKWFMQIVYPLIDDIRLYITDSPCKFIEKRAGRNLPFSKKEVKTDILLSL